MAEPTEPKQRPLALRVALAALWGASAVSIVLALVTYARTVGEFGEVSFWRVLAWQLGIWLPWTGLAPLIAISTLPEEGAISRPGGLFRPLLLLPLIVGLHMAWFYWLSSLFSPYLGAEPTRYGVFPFFFVFWTFLDLAFGALVIGYARLLILQDHAAELLQATGDSTSPKGQGRLIVRSKGRDILLSTDEIMWIGAEDYYASLHTEGGNYLIRRTMKELVGLLPASNFLRVHRSTIINIAFLDRVEPGDKSAAAVILKDGTRRRVSRTGHRRLKANISHWR